MKVDLGQKVQTADGKDLGHVTRLVLDQSGQHVKSVVVEHGLILKDAFEVPSSAFTDSANGAAQISLTSADAKNLPLYDNSKYTDAPPAMSAPFGFPIGGIVWPVAAPIATVPYGQGVYPVAPLVAQPDTPEGAEVIQEPDEVLED